MDKDTGSDRIRHWARELTEGRLSRRQWLRRMLGTGLGLPAIAAVLAETGVTIGTANAAPLRIFNVPKFTGFVFFELAKDGGAQACKELGAEQTYVGTTTADVEGQVQVLQNIIPQRPDGIVIAALDINAPVPVLKQARQRKAVVVTFDADVAQDGRDLFINMAPFEVQAKAMLESALANAPAGGKSIWIAPTPTVANFMTIPRRATPSLPRRCRPTPTSRCSSPARASATRRSTRRSRTPGAAARCSRPASRCRAR